MNYPFELRRREVAAIKARRERARNPAVPRPTNPPQPPPSAPDDALPPDTVAIALSGGGIRSATVCLGLLQYLARKDRLRQVDIMSSVSGGGYTGGFLGRLFARSSVGSLPDPCGRVQEIVGDSQSPQIQWLRAHANYIFSQQSDISEGAAALWRNIWTIYLVLGFLGIAVFGFLRVGGEWILHTLGTPMLPATFENNTKLMLSPWWPVPVAALVFGVTPCSLAFWLAPNASTRASFSFFPMTAWITLLAGLGLSFTLAGSPYSCAVAIAILLATIVWLELSRWKMPKRPDPSARERPVADGTIIRNRLTRALGTLLKLCAVALVWVLLDTMAQGFAVGGLRKLIMAWGAILAPFVPFLRKIANTLGSSAKKGVASGAATPSWTGSPAFKAALIALPLAGFLIVVCDGAVHWLYNHDRLFAWCCVLVCAAISAILGRSFYFLNLSSLHQVYGSRLGRTFLGASNPSRFRAAPDEGGRDVRVSHPNDDISFANYHPENHGGPLHLLGLCVNETVDAASHRDVRDRKGLSMCVGPCGVSVGRRFHSLWVPPPSRLPWMVRLTHGLERLRLSPTNNTALRPLTLAGEEFHVLKGKTDAPVVVESLSLGTWVAVSGAAFGTGEGRNTSGSMALLMGMVNLRLGYWWNSGLSWADRPGHYPANLWQRIKQWPGSLVEMQSILVAEFRGKFAGASDRFWNLSDGGHFDVTGLYELIRRRVPFIIAVNAAEDADFTFADDAGLVRDVRVDFGAIVQYVPNPALVALPAWIDAWVKRSGLGSLSQINTPGGAHAALAQVTYPGDTEPKTWIVSIKASLTGDEPIDIAAHKRTHPAFPNDSTVNQFFTDEIWECYRLLGEHMAESVLQ